MKNPRYLLPIFLCFLTAVIGCSGGDDDITDDTDDGTGSEIGTPVETNSPNTNYAPAFVGQTRIGGVQTTTAIRATIVTSALSAPWGITSLPDGRLLITQKGGQLRIVTSAGAVGSPITGIPAVNSSGQGGLLGLCIDPQFTTNRMVYWVFSEQIAAGTLTAVAKGRLSDSETSIESATVIYRAVPAANSNAHYGGRILFDSHGNLLVSTGERSNPDTRLLAQSVTAALGKIIRITTTGQPAPGNPTVTGAGALPELYSIGHRN
ncbi:MAG TPA: PQQ-dependent sugar dehydrogenase, partial [Chryseolinea sp.]|nr:PQQ-dependent sugar dehydrogenase [Chryseolinea sp.]